MASEKDTPTIIDGSGREYRVAGMDAMFLMQDTDSGEFVWASQHQLAELGNLQAALRSSLGDTDG